MKKLLTGFIFIAMIIFLSSSAYGEGKLDIDGDINNREYKRLLIVYKEERYKHRKTKKYGRGLERIPKAIEDKIKKIKRLENLNIDIVSIDEKEDVEEVIEELNKSEYIEGVEEDVRRSFFYMPNDLEYDLQWGLGNPNINIAKAWQLIENVGAGNNEVVVAVIDSGINSSHEDLVNRIDFDGYNFRSNDYNIEDFHGHGTAVAGIIAAQTDNNIGIAGVVGKFDANILPLKVGEWVSEEIAAINYAIEKKVDVINISMGGEMYIATENLAIQRAVDSGIVVVAAAGNEAQEGNKALYPASYENVISVGSMNELEDVSWFSNYNPYVDLVAPGEGIYSTDRNGKYAYFNGTSFSTPFVAGVCALLKTIDKSLTPKEIEDILFSTATDKGEYGRDDYYGYGIVNPVEAVKTLVGIHEEEYQEFSPKIDVPLDKKWTIRFNMELDGSHINDSNVFIVDKTGIKIQSEISLMSDKKGIIITPIANYESGQEYSLIINKDIKAVNQESLVKSVKMTFITE
ncbi:S8 family serine peptidase [Paramaledivibacter caminithermalis]|uniref:Serine protease, subtilisin family n=1 Tax=Paramaledivibacter caminithermalis (strain DSM 15212 / CIP 107654 / DViRD3) TaxID=1121301 RepID=A0A1M6KEL7_PARC5|nr:S8 family serine peptidase [Paramaledivibacter caminithermalis]SHJ57396.1 Serine protease, subtilisin family [Paramaledivibacter caminithermalis DSM 15212]